MTMDLLSIKSNKVLVETILEGIIKNELGLIDFTLEVEAIPIFYYELDRAVDHIYTLRLKFKDLKK
jgi:hypothetical protein